MKRGSEPSPSLERVPARGSRQGCGSLNSGGGEEEVESAWSKASAPVWLEQRELVIECWISNVSLYPRDRAVLLKFQEWGDSIGAELSRS